MFKWFLAIVLVGIGSNYCWADYPMVDNILDGIALSESSDQPLLIIFGAKWCPHCVNLKADINNGVFTKELDGKIVCYVDVDQHKDMKKQYRVTTLPDSRFLKDKKEVSIFSGYNKTKYKEWLKNVNK